MSVKLKLLDKAMRSGGEIEADERLFNRPWNPALAHRVTVAHAANARTSSSKQKTRAEVKHTTKRLYRQKGTGRARAGMSSSPIRRGGGRAFPNHPQDNYRREINRKEFRAGMATVLSQLVREERLFVAAEIARDEVKTKSCASMINEFANGQKVLFVDTNFEEKFALSTRNLRLVGMVSANRLLATDLMRYRRTVLSKRALERLTEKWAA